MKRRRGTLSVLVLMVLVLGAASSLTHGCSGDTEVSPSGLSPSPRTRRRLKFSTTGAAPEPPAPSAFRSPFAEMPYLPPQPTDLTRVANLTAADLTDAQKEVLARQSFVAVDPPAKRAPLEILAGLRSGSLSRGCPSW